MAILTRVDLVAQILANLGALAAGQTPNAEEAASADSHIDPALAVLAAENVCYIADLSDIPPALFPLIADYIALDAGPEFGQATDDQKMEVAKHRIRLVTRAGPTYAPLIVEYF